MSSPSALIPGTILGGHYIVGDLLNRGGFGAVYRGTDTSEGGRPCAIKETYDVTPVSRRRALMEASVLFTVNSKYLPEVYDALEVNGRFYLIMQLIEGQNLLQLLKSRVPGGRVGEQEPHQLAVGPCSESEVLAWLLPIIDVLQDLHSRNPPVMHRDIKPGNIILTPQHTTVLVDFGLTKLYDPNASTQTFGRAITEGFSPLEQYVGKTSPQSDIYSMAATIYLLLTNRLPPSGMSREAQDRLIPPRQLNPALSPKIEQVLLKALAVYADRRYLSMREFAQALRETTFDIANEQTVAANRFPSGNGQTAGSMAAGLMYDADLYNDPTIAAPAAPAFQPQQPLRLSGANYQGSVGQQQSYGSATPVGSGAGGSPQAYPVLPVGPGMNVPPVKQPTPMPSPAPRRAKRQNQRPLPTPVGQGCLWGLLQGILSALLVLFSRQASDFYLATFCGFIFYFGAGFFTTYRGGAAFRGAWAGYWAGIYGTIIFWVALGVGLAIEFVSNVQNLNRLYPNLDPQTINQRALTNILPVWPQVPLLFPQQPVFLNILAILLAGVVLAWALGLVGGLIGHSRHAVRQATI